MSERLFENIGLLYKLNGIKSKQKRQKVLKLVNREFIICLIECVTAILQHKVHLNDEQLKRLKRHKNLLRELAGTRSEKKARSLLVQKGTGILPFILPPLISLGASLLGDLLQ